MNNQYKICNPNQSGTQGRNNHKITQVVICNKKPHKSVSKGRKQGVIDSKAMQRNVDPK
jgi:hypothetical protein